MRLVWTMALKELNYHFNSSLNYVVVVPFIFISYFLYYRTTLVVGSASLRPYFDLLPWFLIILSPALTMQTLSEEKNRKTLELLLAHPISEFKIVLSKFMAVFVYFVFILGITLSLTLPLFIFSKVDSGVIFGQYLGALFVASTFLSVGIFASAFCSNLISSFLLAATINFSLLIFGLDFVILSSPWPLNSLMDFLSIIDHSQNLSRGLLDVADLVYFVTLSALFLIGAVFKISQTKIAEKKTEKSKLVASLLFTVVLGILLNTLAINYPVRIDLTAEKSFSLSLATKETLAKVDDSLSIKIFISPDLPSTLNTLSQEVRDLVTDYRRYNHKISIQNFSPKDGNNDEKEAQNYGINPVQFNTMNVSSYQLQKGYLGLAMRFGGKTEALPFIASRQNLEYLLTTRINKLTSKKPVKIGFYSTSTQLQFTHFSQALSSQYQTESVKLDKSLHELNLDLLIMAGLDLPLTNEELNAFKNYMAKGGKALLLVDKVGNGNDGQIASLKSTNLEEYLKEYGINLNSDLVYDLSLAETIQYSQAGTMFLTTYPFWFKALPAESKFPPTNQIRAVTLLWPGSLTLNPKEGYDSKIILKSSKNANTKTDASLNVSPAKLKDLDLKPGDEELLLAVLISLKNGPPVLSVVTDSKFASDNYFSPSSQNLPFAISLTDYLALSGKETVPLRSGGEDFLIFNAPWQPAATQWGETAGLPLLLTVLFSWRLWRRRVGYNRVYEKLG